MPAENEGACESVIIVRFCSTKNTQTEHTKSNPVPNQLERERDRWKSASEAATVQTAAPSAAENEIVTAVRANENESESGESEKSAKESANGISSAECR
jgi:hypothetical protein